MRARNGNYRQAIIRPFTAALDKLLEMDIIDWNYREGEEFPENYNDFFQLIVLNIAQMAQKSSCVDTWNTLEAAEKTPPSAPETAKK